jgi:DNA replication protein DnaC
MEQKTKGNNPPNRKTLELINKTCRDCGNGFEVRVIKALGVILPSPDICPDCIKKRETKKEAEGKRIFEEYKKARIRRWRLDSGIPPKFQNERFETFKPKNDNQKRKLALCKNYAEEFPINGRSYKSLALFSSKVWGHGKSHLVASIGHRVIDRWWWDKNESPVYYISEPDLFIRIRASFNRRNDYGRYETEQDIYNQLKTVPLLIIDDVGKEEVSDPRFVQRVWFSIVNGRYDNLKPIVITANLTPDELASYLGGNRNNEASFDRLWEMLGGKFDEVIGDSHRREELK